MFNVGGGELLVIMLIALIVLGPERLPDAARQIGKAMGDLRRLSTSFQDEVRGALDTPADATTRPRDVLAAEPDEGDSGPRGGATSAAVASVSEQAPAPRRRTPPADETATETASSRGKASETVVPKAGPRPSTG